MPIHPWFSSVSSPTVSHFSLITDHSALPPTLTRTYDWGIRYRDDLIRRINHLNEDATHYALHDYYNVTAITDSAGEVLERYGYSAFGDVRFMTAAYATKANSDHTWDLLYKAQFLDIETGFYNYGYRYLSPILGRWLSRDPIGERGGLNLYGFVINNGLNGTDLYGLDVWAFSGIRFSLTQENRNYVRAILNRSPNDEIESSNVSGEPHSTMKDHPSASDKALIFGLLLFAKTQLVSEARRKAEKAVSPGQFCKSCSRKKTSIALFMVAPKRIPQNLPETECCNISYIIYFDSADLVPQGGIFSSWKDHWTGKNVSGQSRFEWVTVLNQ
jgi:RHS repeat-associated protein